MQQKSKATDVPVGTFVTYYGRPVCCFKWDCTDLSGRHTLYLSISYGPESQGIMANESEPGFYSFGNIASGILTHVLCIVFTLFVTVLAKPGTSLFSWHPFLMTLAFSLFMTEAVLVFSPHCSPIWKLSHKTKGRVHWILQCLCASSGTLGLVSIIYNKHVSGKPHFTSWHGQVGLGTACVVGMQCLAALPLLYHSLAKGWSLARLKRYHAVSGLVTYLLGSASLLLGMCSAWFTGTVGGQAWYLFALCPVFSTLVVMSQVSNTYMAKKRLVS
ncbi:cytochrome b561 domain-containing protein 2 isoform X1 [Esox lucius]|uniref:ascorbate ferrireductase (transmembrane) n=2 Tax=Esox lucius TaxID=8010 RepID=A0A6Q2YGC7_ESOLU|nr:cytochrome b561 domain-containing protein 2 isoform X1 [Esox lucius]